MITKERLEDLMCESIGSEHWYRRPPFMNLIYTGGVSNVQEEANMYWFVDMVGSWMPEVVKTFQKERDGFFIVTLKVEKDHKAVFKIIRETVKNGKYIYPEVAKQEIEYVDLPECELKFFLELDSPEPIFCLYCPSEH